MSQPSSIHNGGQDVSQAVEAVRPVVDRLADKLWDLAEISLHEVESAEAVIRELAAGGFTVVSRGTAGVPTAFVAEWTQGEGGPVVGFLAEYDALPGLGNAAVPRQEPRSDGKTSGHGCGHNLIGAGCVGAALIARQAMLARGIPGTLRVYGCAAEETEGAKIYMARDGQFNDLDAALHWHPSPYAAVMNLRLTANNAVKIEFFGRTAHAGIAPWEGRSALDAMELAAHALNQMREHVEPSARIHYIFEASGTAPNIVPEYARMWLKVRDLDRGRVNAITEWVRQIAEGAALATQTRATVNVYYGLHDLLPNRPLAERMQTHLERVGVPAWTQEEQAFASACEREAGLPAKGLATTVMPLQPELALGGSSDVGDVSWITPTMGVSLPMMPIAASAHNWVMTACGGTSIGRKSALAAAHVLALTALDLMTDAELRAAARADFDRRTQGYTYVSPLPPDQQHPIGLPDWLNNDGTVETAAGMAHQMQA